MIKNYLIILFLSLPIHTSQAQMSASEINYLYDECKSERFLEFSLARIMIYKLHLQKAELLNSRAELLNLKQMNKWDYVREQIAKEDDETFTFRKNRERDDPAKSSFESYLRLRADVTFELMRTVALTVFSENIDPRNSERINRRIVEECMKLVPKMKLRIQK